MPEIPQRTRWSALVLCACAAAAAPAAAIAQDAAATADRLAALEREGDPSEIESALREAAAVADEKVVKRIAGFTRSRELAVRSAAIEALGRNPHASAVKELHDLYRRDTKLREDERLFALLLREIGRQGDPSSVKVLADDPFDHLTIAVGRARIMGFARIRTDESLAALTKAMQKVGPPPKSIGGREREGEWSGKFRDFGRAALVILTGVDQGFSRESWLAWWRKNERSFKVAPEPPAVTEDVASLWQSFWGEPYGGATSAPGGGAVGASAAGCPFEVVLEPSKEVVSEAVKALETAFKGGEAQAKVDAIQSYGGVADDAVVHALARGLRERQPGVKLAAAEALGWSKRPEALKQLHREYRRNSKLSDEETCYVAVLQGIGRHGDPSSIDVLGSNPFEGLTYASGRARLMGLANIRDRKAVEEIFKLMKLGGSSSGRARLPPERRFAEDVRLALAVLTGQDLGASKEAWEEWWRKSKASFKIAPQRPDVPGELRERWQAFWGEAY